MLYDFAGFFAPVDNPPTTNVVNAGRAIPVKFSLHGDHGLDVFATAPRFDFGPCSTSLTDAVETTAAATRSGLSYDASSDQYTYVWKTDRSWAGRCGTLHITLGDGTTRSALFKFTK